MSRRLSRLVALALAAAWSTGVPPVAATDVIYRCTAGDGQVTLQNNQPCPAGTRQERREIEPVPTSTPAPPIAAPASVSPLVPGATAEADAATADAAASAPEAGAGSTDAVAAPAPPLFACRTWDRKQYLTDTEEPAQRCAPLRPVGLDGNPALGAGFACEQVRDRCEAVPAASLCAQWQRFWLDTLATLTFGRSDDPEATQAELQRIETVIAASDCSGDGAGQRSM